MLTFPNVDRRLARSALALAGAVMLAAALGAAAAPAQAQEVSIGGCIGSWRTINCVTGWGPAGDPYIRVVPPPPNAAARERARQRERRWVDRCRPVIRPDRYGVGRYHYALPGCEFGIWEN